MLVFVPGKLFKAFFVLEKMTKKRVKFLTELNSLDLLLQNFQPFHFCDLSYKTFFPTSVTDATSQRFFPPRNFFNRVQY